MDIARAAPGALFTKDHRVEITGDHLVEALRGQHRPTSAPDNTAGFLSAPLARRHSQCSSNHGSRIHVPPKEMKPDTTSPCVCHRARSGRQPVQGAAQFNPDNSLAGGGPFGPFTSGNLSPENNDLPAGMMFEQFKLVL